MRTVVDAADHPFSELSPLSCRFCQGSDGSPQRKREPSQVVLVCVLWFWRLRWYDRARESWHHLWLLLPSPASNRMWWLKVGHLLGTSGLEWESHRCAIADLTEVVNQYLQLLPSPSYCVGKINFSNHAPFQSTTHHTCGRGPMRSHWSWQIPIAWWLLVVARCTLTCLWWCWCEQTYCTTSYTDVQHAHAGRPVHQGLWKLRPWCLHDDRIA